MYNIKVSDFIDIKENRSNMSIDDLIHICKRRNNIKREYLFVNRYQGKHIPQSPYLIEEVLTRFSKRVCEVLNPNERVLVVGFAETATGIAQYLTYYLTSDKKFARTVVYYLQTTREKYDAPRLFTFDEEHSHAVNQILYSRSVLPTFDRVLFVEDEITTGKTILNFINKFKMVYPDCKYTVASILNWQNDCCIQQYKDIGIDRIYLVAGKIKSDLPKISLENELEPIDYFTQYENYQSTNEDVILAICGIDDARMGVFPTEFTLKSSLVEDAVMTSVYSDISDKDSVMVIGTEEFMFYPLKVARDIQLSLGANVWYRATTRSPIIASSDGDYEIQDSIILPSAYDSHRQTYLYNMNGAYKKILVVSDVEMSNGFVEAMTQFAKNNNKQIYFVYLK